MSKRTQSNQYRKKFPLWNNVEDQLIMENMPGCSNITHKAHELSKVINRSVNSIINRYYSVLKPKKIKVRRSLTINKTSDIMSFLPNTKEESIFSLNWNDNEFVTSKSVIKYYDIDHREYSTHDEAKQGSIDYIIDEMLEEPREDVHQWVKDNKDKINYLLTN